MREGTITDDARNYVMTKLLPNRDVPTKLPNSNSGRSPQPEDGLHLPVIQVIMDMLEALRASNSLYDKLTPHTPLILGKDFSGTPHCEACLCLLKCKNLCTEPHAKVVGWLQEKLRVCPSSFIP